MHLGMSGSFRVDIQEPNGSASIVLTTEGTVRHDHGTFHMSTGAIVTFNDPRRFGFMDLVSTDAVATHPVLSKLGPEPLSADFDAAALRGCMPGQDDVAQGRAARSAGGGGAREHLCERGAVYGASIPAAPGVDHRDIVRVATPVRLRVGDGHQAGLTEAINRLSWPRPTALPVFVSTIVKSERCRRSRCRGTIRRRTQAGRSTFFCPVCQR